jgi:hypothetical protein
MDIAGLAALWDQDDDQSISIHQEAGPVRAGLGRDSSLFQPRRLFFTWGRMMTVRHVASYPGPHRYARKEVSDDGYIVSLDSGGGDLR